MLLLKAVEQVNELQKGILVEKVKRHFGSDLSNHTFAVWGLSFKPRTDDMRDAPSITVIRSLLQAGARIQAFDPGSDGGSEEGLRRAGAICGAELRCLRRRRGSDRPHGVEDQLRRPDFQRIKKLLKSPVIFDGRNIYNPADLKKIGFRYYSIGRIDG